MSSKQSTADHVRRFAAAMQQRASGELASTAEGLSQEGQRVADGAIAAHIGAADPHPQYLTQEEADALYAPLGGGGGAVTVREADGSPSANPVSVVEFDGATVSDEGGGVARVTITGGGGGAPAHAYYSRLAALLEPDAIEQVRVGAFSYAISASETKYLLASWQTRLGSSGRLEQRNPRAPLPLRGVTLSGTGADSTAIILDPALPTYADAWATYHDRLEQIATLPTRYLPFTGASQRQPFLPGPYGVVLTQTTVFDLAWIALLWGSYGVNLADEISDADVFRVSNALALPLSKRVVSQALSGSVGSGAGGLTWVICPASWGAIADPLTYLLRDDFMGTSLDTASVWARAQSSAGNVEIATLYQWLKLQGNNTWGANGLYAQTTFSRTAGRAVVVDVFPGITGAATPNLFVGWSDGAGHSFSNFVHGVDFTESGAKQLQVFEGGTSRGTVGSGYTMGHIYRVRVTLQSSGAVYEVQGGPEYPALGGASWQNITPGTTAGSGGGLRPGATIYTNTAIYVSDMRVY